MKTYLFLLLIITTFFITSCGNSSQKEESKTTENKQIIIPEIDVVDSSFTDFIEKFSSDSLFQLSRIRFPLNIKWFNIDDNIDSNFYLNINNYEILEFRNNKSENKIKNRNQKILIAEDKQSAKIEIQGIDSCILIYYLFVKENGIWILVEVNDKST